MISAAFEQEVLCWILDDYESPSSITGDIARELGRPVMEAEVADALASLVIRGLAQAFRFQDGAWLVVSPGQMQGRDNLWFMASPEGRKAADAAV